MGTRQVSVNRNWLFVYVLANSVLFTSMLFILGLARPEDVSWSIQAIALFGVGITGIAGSLMPLRFG